MKNPALSIWCVATGCESKLLVIGISVAIGKEQGLELWSDGVLEWWKRIRSGVLWPPVWRV
jgi:hypothetical protein